MHPHRRKALSAFLITLAFACLLFCLAPRTASPQSVAPRPVTQTPEHSTSLNPAISGDGRRLVFESTANLAGGGSAAQFRAWVADTSGEQTTFAPLAASRAPAAAVSQDGGRVAFSSAEDLTGANPDRNPEIFLSDAGTLRQITNTSPSDPAARLRDGNFQPSISDDGRFVAFASNRDPAGANADGGSEIFVFDSLAGSFTRITDGAADSTDAKISGDGTRVAFIRSTPQQSPADAAVELVLHERATGAARVLFKTSSRLALTPGRAVSDDGLRVAFSAEDSRGATQVFLFDGRNDILRQLTQLGTRQADVPLHPSISGDGSRVAFATRRSVVGGNSDSSVELYLYDIPTNRLSRLTDAPREATAEVVSSLDDTGAAVAFNFPRVLASPVGAEEFANTSEIFLARPPARAPFSADLQILHAATLGREPSPEKVLAPGQIALARGTNLSLFARQSARTNNDDFPRAFGGVTVTVSSLPARIFFVSPAQINFQVPEETATGAAEVVVRNHDGYESRATVRIASAAPGIFTERGDGTGAAVALDALTQTRAPFDPVDAANHPRRIAIFATGVARARNLSVSVAGRDAAVEAVVPSDTLPGLDEIHVRLRHSLAGAGAARSVVTADGRASNAATIQFVGTRRPVRVTLTPDSASLGVGRSLTLAAKVFDAEGGEIADAPVSFNSSDETVATVDAGGVVRAAGAGAATIRATAGEASAAARLQVHTLSLVINEVLADPPDGPAGDANRDGVRSPSQDEFVEIVNASEADFDLGGYQLTSRNSTGADVVRHVFARGTILAPGTAAVVFGGAEAATFNPLDPAFGGALVLNASTGGLSLLNGASTVTLLSPAGAVVEQLTYGGDSPLDGDRNQSLTRAPDVAGDFAPHLSANAARAFSPGTKVDGAQFLTTAPVARVEIAPAAATVQTGEQRQFEARAFDAAGRELRGVIFRWESGDAAIASVNQNGLASAHAAGTAEIVARARGVQSPPATLTVVPPPPRVVRVGVTPAAASINRGGTHTFAARAFDREGNAVADAVFSWSSGNTAVAVVDREGLARGVGVGSVTITASTPDGAGGTVSATASLEVRVPLVLNELLADVPPDDPATAAVEGDANRDGVRDSGGDEFVELFNNSADAVDLSGLRLSDATGLRFTFPAGASLAAGRAAVVLGGGSPPSNDPAFGGALVLRAGTLSLNDGGDTITLKLPVGPAESLIFSQTYGTAGGPAAPADQSLTRSPDASQTTGAAGGFAPHLAAPDSAGRNFSPGTRADGTPFGSPPVARIQITPSAATLDIGGAQTFNARAFADCDGTEIEITNTSFIWGASDAAKVSLAPTTGVHTDATARAAGQITIRARAGGREATAMLTVKPPPPALTRVELTPQSASLTVGETQRLTARAFDQYGAPFPVTSFTFASSAPATASVTAQGFVTGGTEAAAAATAHAAGSAQLTATASDDTRSVTSAPAAIVVEPPPAVPAAGQIVINEALVAFPTSSTQARADFVELYNTTDRTLDISGLVVAFRPSGTSNTPRNVSLPGAVGSRTVIIQPRGYFLIANGPTTFGAAADFAVAGDGFNLNNTTGGMKIEIGSVKLDGLTYQQEGGTAVADVFKSYGEGAIFGHTGTSSATNDFVRSPNATDTDNNFADFRRNGTAANVSPKAANP